MNMRKNIVSISLAVLFSVVGLQSVASTLSDVSDYEGTLPIITQSVPDNSKRLNMKFVKYGQLGELKAQIPSYDGKGKLIASWTPSDDVYNNWTFVVLHGGTGIGSVTYRQATEIRRRFNANVLILDSFWVRGVHWNGGRVQDLEKGRRIDSNERAFDLSAAGRWLAMQGVDPKKTVLFGGSQGGHLTMRALTDDPLMRKLIDPYYSHGVAVYPSNSEQGEGRNERAVPVGPYYKPLIIMIGGEDYRWPPSEFNERNLSATKYIYFPNATHGWDRYEGKWIQDPPASIDGNCKSMVTDGGQRIKRQCHNTQVENTMYEEVAKFIGLK